MKTFFKALYNVIKGFLKLFLVLGLLYGLVYAYGFALFAVDLADRRLSTDWHIHLVVNDHKCVESARLIDPTSTNPRNGVRFCEQWPSYMHLSTSDIFQINEQFLFELPKLTVEYKEEGHNMVTIDIDFNDCLQKSPNYWHDFWDFKYDGDITVNISNPYQPQIFRERYIYTNAGIHTGDKVYMCENSIKIH